MTYYSRYRRHPFDWNPIICAIVIAAGWAIVSEMDYQDAISVSHTRCLHRGY